MGELKAGDEGGEEQHQQTDGERMLNEIAQQKEMLNAMPGDSRPGICAKAPHANKLGQLEFRYQLVIEKERLSSVLAKFEEEHGVLYSEPCPICLEDIHFRASERLTEVFTCCGGFMCKICALDIYERLGRLGLGKCPLCRENFSDEVAKDMALAKRGVLWAQANLGRRMVYGMGGIEKQEKPGLVWLNKAAAHNHPGALYTLAALYNHGMGSVLQKSKEKANELMTKSANLGYAAANSSLAIWCFHGTRDGFENNQEEAYLRASTYCICYR